MNSLKNIEHSTLDAQHAIGFRITSPAWLRVECSRLNVFPSMSGGFQ